MKWKYNVRHHALYIFIYFYLFFYFYFIYIYFYIHSHIHMYLSSIKNTCIYTFDGGLSCCADCENQFRIMCPSSCMQPYRGCDNCIMDGGRKASMFTSVCNHTMGVITALEGTGFLPEIQPHRGCDNCVKDSTRLIPIYG